MQRLRRKEGTFQKIGFWAVVDKDTNTFISASWLIFYSFEKLRGNI
jgi:hypothetical protein